MSRGDLATLVVSLILCFVALSATPLSLATPPTKEDMIGVWSGYAQSELEFLRLELDSGGKGFLAVSYLPDDPPQLYEVTSWVLVGTRMNISVRQIDKNAEPIIIKKVWPGLNSMRLEIGDAAQSKAIGWSSKAVLYREIKLKARSQLAEDKIKNYRRWH